LRGFSKVATANPSQVRRAASPHLPLSLDDDASPHIRMYLAVVPLLARALEGVCIPLSWTQSSRVQRSFVVRRDGVRSAVPVDPDDLRSPLDGDVGRLEAEVLDQDRPRWMFCALAVGCLCAPAAETTNSVPPTTRAATVINKMMRLISLTSLCSFSRPTAEKCVEGGFSEVCRIRV
jgi:hypothetical protein